MALLDAAHPADVVPRVPVLIAGAVLAPGRRTVAAALRVAGRGTGRLVSCGTIHRVQNRARWSGLAVARVLLGLLVGAFRPGLSRSASTTRSTDMVLNALGALLSRFRRAAEGKRRDATNKR